MVIAEPGERRGEARNRRRRRLLEAERQVVDDGQREREEQICDRRGQEEPARAGQLPLRREVSPRRRSASATVHGRVAGR